MSTNEVIREFNISDIMIDSFNLYLNFIIDRKKAINKGAKYIKVCVDTTENVGVLPRGINDIFLDDLSFSFKSKGSPAGLNLYKFEDNLLDLTIDEEETTSLKEYPISINRNKMQMIIKPNIFAIEKPHIFKVYILNKNKNVLEKYSWPSLYNLDEYKPTEEGDEFLFSSLESSLDLIFTPYNIFYNLGPYLKIDTQLLDNPALNFENIFLEILYREKSYSFERSQIDSNSSSSLISRQIIDSLMPLQTISQENYSQSIFSRSAISEIMLRANNSLIFDIYKTFSDNSLLSDLITYKIRYNNEEIIKEKLIDKSTIDSLYLTYFNKNKDSIIKSTFNGKFNIRALQNQSGSTIRFKQYEKIRLPISTSQTKIKLYRIINGQEIHVLNLYSSTSFDEDLKITTYNNQGFLLSSLYERPDNSSQFYIKRQNYLESESFRIYLNDVNVFETTINYADIDSVTGRSLPGRLDYDRPFNLNFQVNKSFKNPILISPNTIIFDTDSFLTIDNIETAARYGYLTNNNENLETQIINNVIMLCDVTNRQRNLSCSIPIRLKNVQQNKIFTLTLPFNIQIGESIEINIKTLMLPYEMCDKLISNYGSDDDKEKIAEYLNLIAPNKYVEIDRLTRNLFFKASQELTVIRSIFIIVSDFINSVSFLVSKNLNLNELLDNVREFEDLNGI